MGKRLTEEEYDKRIAAHGLAVRIEPFKGTKRKILHRCLKHGEEHLSLPGHILNGHGMSCCRRCLKGNSGVEEKYDKEIARHGKVKRLGNYLGNSKKILHLCLIHNKDYYAFPSDLRKGGVLPCCLNLKDQKTPTKIFNETERLKEQEIYDQILEHYGRVLRIEDYQSRKIKIKHKCLTHGEIHLGYPASLVKGGSIACCLSSIKNHKKAKNRYDNVLKKFGKVERLEEYINSKVPISHRCLQHGKIYKVAPARLISGQGLKCCSSSNNRKNKAKCTYDERIAKFGRVVRIEEYKGSTRRILHKCLIHDEIHYGTPSNLLSGGGLSCCRKSGYESLYNLLVNNHKKETCFYCFHLVNFPGRIKLGISNRVDIRSKNPEYGKLISQWHLDSRLEAYLVEQACLKDVLLIKNPPEKLSRAKWPGYTEIVESEEKLVVDVAQFYVDKLEELGPHKFILDYLHISEEEKEMCLEKLKRGS